MLKIKLFHTRCNKPRTGLSNSVHFPPAWNFTVAINQKTRNIIQHLSYFRTNIIIITHNDNVDNKQTPFLFFVRTHYIINLLVNPGSSSENVKNPLLISSVLGAKIFDVAVCGLGGDEIGVAVVDGDDEAEEETGDDGETTSKGFSTTFANLLLFSSCTTTVSCSFFDLLQQLNCAAE